MKFLFLLFLLPASLAMAQTKKPAAKPKPAIVYTSTDSLSYALAVMVADFYRNQGLEKVSSGMIKKAFDDVYNNKPLLISQEQANMTIQEKMHEFMSKKINVVKEESTKFLEANKKREGVITLPSGLQYEIITKGTGPIPKDSDHVKAHYAGTLIDGKEFDNSYKRGQPIEIPVTGVIKGWVEALQLMPVGSKWKLFIPSDLAYGDRGAGADIPGGAALIFDIELLEIVGQ
ncbi:MAG: FKBP-type peptidyl-prolyl cis-trans isomerase [Ginsengibacter sp.]|jgi:FKBP-type peptidyl-prolyl cis-trans isomerase